MTEIDAERPCPECNEKMDLEHKGRFSALSFKHTNVLLGSHDGSVA